MSFQTKKTTTEDKNSFYKLLIQQVEGLLSVESDLIANAANLSSLLFNSLKQVNWVGFYLLKDNELVLGPFHGQVACTRIPLGRGVCGTALGLDVCGTALGLGVCGTAFSQNETLRIADVNAFKGHIACDKASASEIVIPLTINNTLVGVLDIDSPILDRFNQDDQTGLERIAQIYCDSIVNT